VRPRTVLIPAICLIAAVAAFSFGRPADIPFEKHVIDLGANESVSVADVNGDGKLDIVSGENWYAGPKWTKQPFRDIYFFNNYIDNFSDHTIDVNGDGRLDVVSCSWFSKRLVWYENPGKGAQWPMHEIDSGNNVEFCWLVDLDNDGKARELLPQFGGAKANTAWYEIKDKKWVKHVASPNGYGHGIGAGDVNGDGRADILTPKGWLEAPADPRQENWTLHPDWDSKAHLGFIYVYDVNGDKRNDVVTSNAHDYGIFWLEQTASGKFEKRMIDDSWSQAHAVTLVDLNGDGRNPGGREPLGVYWYESQPAPDGKGLTWTKHVVDYSTRAGGGMQIAVVDIDGDGDLDLVTPGKGGLFLFENLTKGKR
jgi:hypothetical protein